MKTLACILCTLLAILLVGCGTFKIDVHVTTHADATTAADRSACEPYPTIIPIEPGPIFDARTGELTETFENSDLPGWEFAGHATVQNGVLRLESGDLAGTSGAWGDLILRIRVRRVGEGVVKVSYRAVEGVAYRAVLSDDYVLLERDHVEQVVQLGTAAVAIPTGEWFQLTVTAIDDEHTISIDGKTVLTASDPDPLPPGGITIAAVGLSYAEFDDLEVRLPNDEP